MEPFVLMSRAEGTNLILGITPETNWDNAIVLFEHAGWAVSTENSEASYQKDDPNSTEGKRFLLLHSHPEEAIALAIAKGVSPGQASEAWLNAAAAMVNFYKRHRKQAVMIYQPNLLADPEAQLTSIAMQLGLPDNDFQTTMQDVEKAPVLERLIASQLLMQTPGIIPLLAQIEACTLPLAGGTYNASALDFDAANSQLTEIRRKLLESEELAMRLQREALLQLAAKQEVENAANAERNRIHAILRSAEGANRKLEEEMAGQHRHHTAELVREEEQQAQLRSQLTEMRLQSREIQNESNLLLEQLHLVQEELEEKFFSQKQLQEQLVKMDAQQQTTQKAKQETERVLAQSEQQSKDIETKYAENSSKLRRLEDANLKLKEDIEKRVTSHKQLEERLGKKEEKILKDEQDHIKINAELSESLNQKILSMEKENRKIEVKLDARIKKNTELMESRNEHCHALEAANQKIQCLLREIDSFRSSIAYRITAPVRALKTRIRRRQESKAFKKPTDLVKKSGLFNEEWYLKSYPDVAENGINPIYHYLKFGVKEHRNPSPDFDTHWYLGCHTDVLEAGMNPLLHYIKFGQPEGRSTIPDDQPSFPTLRAA